MSNHLLIVRSILATTAEWRKRVLTAHPTDRRNTTAAELLDRLAAEPDSMIHASVIESLGRFSDSEFTREAKTAARLVGFKVFPSSLASFLGEVVQRIDGAHAEWANAFRSEGGAR